MSKKTLGKISANLIKILYNKNKAVFSITDVQKIINKNINKTSDLLSELVKRNIISRLKAGKYIIIPQELGDVDNYIGNWLIAGKEIVNTSKYYIAFYTAMDLLAKIQVSLFQK